MKFHDFFILSELSDLPHRVTSGIEFEFSAEDDEDEYMGKGEVKKGLGVFSREFLVGGDSYKVIIKQIDFSEFPFYEQLKKFVSSGDLDGYFKNVYSVSFRGPQGYELTGLNKRQYTVYSQVLLSIKKFMEDHLVEGIHFSAAHSSMSLVYDRFVKSFTNFQIVSQNLYLSKDLVSRMVSKYPKISGMLNKNVKSYASDLGKIRENKVKFRKNLNLLNSVMNKVVVFAYYQEYSLGIVASFDKEGSVVVYNLTSPAMVNMHKLYRLGDHKDLQDQLGWLFEKYGEREVYSGILPSDDPVN